MSRMNSIIRNSISLVEILASASTANSRFRFALASAVLLACFPSNVASQATTPALRPRAAQLAPPSNSQLANPAIEARVNRLLRQMTLEEKIGQLVQYNDTGNAAAVLTPLAGQPAPPGANNPGLVALNPDTGNHVNVKQLIAEGRLGSMLNTIGAQHSDTYQHLAVDKSRLHIPLLFGADVIHGYRTIYPVPLAVAATFDPDLAAALSRMSAEESVTAGIRWVYSPMVDISRDPRWGRTVEGAGEDPYLGAAMARACVKGYQGDDLAKPGSVLVAVKHFAAYGAAEAGREYNTADISPITLRQVYLPPYHAAVEAGAATIMSAFNSLNGVPSSANHFLLTDILRREWGFNGFVISDYDAVRERFRRSSPRSPHRRRRYRYDVARLRHRVARAYPLRPGSHQRGR